MKQMYVVFGVVAIAALFVAGLWYLYQGQQPAATNEVDAARKVECENFMMVATFPDDGSADLFLEACLRGEPVLPDDQPGEANEPVPGPSAERYIGPGCAIGGCSSQICGEAGEVEDMVTTCEYREEYACYENARCEKQSNGQCGWTETSELTQCLSASASTQGELMVY